MKKKDSTLSKEEQRLIRIDRMRYTKDKTSSTLILLAIVVDALYFISIYQSDLNRNPMAIPYLYSSWVIGASIIYNLIFLLVAFLASEGVKNRQNGFTIPLIVLGGMQFARIFYLPAKAIKEYIVEGEPTMGSGQHLYVVACLAISGVFCIAAAIISYTNNKTLARYMRSLEEKSE